MFCPHENSVLGGYIYIYYFLKLAIVYILYSSFWIHTSSFPHTCSYLTTNNHAGLQYHTHAAGGTELDVALRAKRSATWLPPSATGGHDEPRTTEQSILWTDFLFTVLWDSTTALFTGQFYVLHHFNDFRWMQTFLEMASFQCEWDTRLLWDTLPGALRPPKHSS